MTGKSRDLHSLAPLVLGHELGEYASGAFLKRIQWGEDNWYRPMDRLVARENLKLFKKAMDGSGLEFFLFFGTLLGAVRGGDFIAHDYDTDTVIMEPDRPRLLEASQALLDAGFELARAKNGINTMFTFLRQGEFIDVYLASERRRFPCKPCFEVDGVLLDRDLLTGFTSIEFLGESFRVPLRRLDALAAMYGPDWGREKKNSPAHVPFDWHHPFRSSKSRLLSLVPRGAKRRLKRLLHFAGRGG